MGQTPSIPETATALNPRVPPSPSTYAKFLASQTFSHLPPDSRAQFSHQHHQHFGPAQGIYDCPQKSERIEDRIGHCFTIRGEEGVLDLRDISRANGKVGNEVLRFGTRDHSERLLVGEEPGVFTKGDAFGVLVAVGIVVLMLAVGYALRWVLRLGRQMRADARELADLESMARAKFQPETGIILRRGRSVSLVRVRRGGFCDVLPEEIKMELIREASDSRERKMREFSEKYKDGEFQAYWSDNDSAASDDEDEEEGNTWTEVSLKKQREWEPDLYGDLSLLRT